MRTLPEPRWVCLLVLAGAGLWGCSPTGFGTPECKFTTDCQQGEVCLNRVGQCAPKCDSDSQCADGQTCSGGGGCVSPGACGSDLDCSGGKVCGAAGACEAPCTPSSCGADQTCGPAGHCIAKVPPASDPAPGAPPSAAPTCGGEAFNTGKVQANFLTLFDKSGSMSDVVGGEAKYPAATRAVNTLVREHQSTIRFGLTMFPIGAQDDTECVPEPMSVPIGDNSADAIAGVLAAREPGGKTPLGAVVKTAHDVAALKDPTRSNFVLMVTDGMETCRGDVVDEVEKLFDNNVKTYVIGFGDEVSARTLTAMATEGGTARASFPRYYQADDPASLSASLAAIVRGVVGCEFHLVKAPPDLSKVFVYVNGQLASHDPTRQNGWSFNPANNRLTLYGSACEQVSNTPGSKVSTIYGCPDVSLVEGAPGTTCSSNEQCISGTCSNGVCAGGLPGATCAANNECLSGSCKAGVCEGGTPAKPAGSTCQSNGQCISGSCVQGICEGGSGGLPGGSNCHSGSECAAGVCIDGTCGKPGGSTCASHSECKSRQCVDGLCEGGVDGGKPDGAPCSSNPECASQNCSAGTCQSSVIN